MVKKGDIIVVWFSCGAASAMAAKKTVEMYGDITTIHIVNTTIHEEESDNLRFLLAVQEWIGIKIETRVNSKYPSSSAVEVWENRKYMSGTKGAPCTQILKKETRYQWEQQNHHDWLVMGFTAEEQGRHENFKMFERDNILPILIDAGISKNDCFKAIQDAGIKLPEMYLLGYPNANCIGCVKATSPTYWNHVRKVHPLVFEARAEQSRRIGCRLTRVKGKRLFLDELPADAQGRSMKNMNVECGIFCEMKAKL